jgi:flagellar biosynthetic protein FlhB
VAEENQSQEKTEEATPRKLEKARGEGQVARSRELNSVAIVTFGSLAAIVVAPYLASEVMKLAQTVFANAAAPNITMTHFLGEAFISTTFVLLPLLVVIFAAGVASSLGLGGMVLAPKALRPKLERMSPIKGFGRIFSIKSLVELGKSIAKFILIAGVAVLVLSYLIGELLALGALPVEAAIAKGMSYAGIALLLIGSTLIVVAAIDVPFQIAQHKKQLKMTKQEVKDELKDSEGKPEVKAKIRALQQQTARRQMLEQVPEADVVIVNPEHFSVAIKYDAAAMAAPIMVAKGVDHMALKIREIADAHDVPIVREPPLARSIYYTTEAGEEVPAGLYVAVAQVLAYIYQLEQYQRGQVKNAPVMPDIEIPAEFATEGRDE